jgi:hypothetical protein
MIGEVVVGVDRGQPMYVKNIMTERRCRLSNPCWGRLLPERAAAAWISFLLYVWVARSRSGQQHCGGVRLSFLAGRKLPLRDATTDGRYHLNHHEIIISCPS